MAEVVDKTETVDKLTPDMINKMSTIIDIPNPIPKIGLDKLIVEKKKSLFDGLIKLYEGNDILKFGTGVLIIWIVFMFLMILFTIMEPSPSKKDKPKKKKDKHPDLPSVEIVREIEIPRDYEDQFRKRNYRRTYYSDEDDYDYEDRRCSRRYKFRSRNNRRYD